MNTSPEPLARPRQGFVQCANPNGLHRMAYTEWGDPDNPRVLVCVHGLTRSGRDFDRVARALADVYRVVCPDVVGRGLSDWLPDPARYAVPQYVADMVTLIARLGVETVDWFGTSMGGLIGMSLAGLTGTPIRKLLVNDIGPHIEPEALARIGSYVGQPARFESLEEGIDHAALLAASFGPLTHEQWREINTPLLRQRKDGAWEFRYDPGIAMPFAAADVQANMAGEAMLWHLFEAIACPVLIVRGALSDLLSRDTVAQMIERGRAVTSIEVPGVGHAPAFVDPEQIGIARRFFAGDGDAS
ncbi:alpha/beta hydrolase [Trinickia caryophylli]|uniref:Pimeloyl-ACP methyl ester carboxylesterase n=1 Tax=Trinickia caryophylli TaxID=28094 RepID=A0A1X7CP39_TRICW|nr:alpha/beta hydrolase [Trinickia caryophylli]PMS11247.1 alpha/beta hydrolase [Trinickia caryophylli]TRX20101.1 alpha/beta hydrolase [Trinickia caryophylli]WQE12549.1 alpha/beta hydrolase [Trinickia caryophylli]SME99787.1 Pimeloyl-ACP methyl ester carboxylesterase [Trinickia caryophylli]GLU30237.1 alpha/beta hydrolase [Trinickia caryophylli]